MRPLNDFVGVVALDRTPLDLRGFAAGLESLAGYPLRRSDFFECPGAALAVFQSGDRGCLVISRPAGVDGASGRVLACRARLDNLAGLRAELPGTDDSQEISTPMDLVVRSYRQWGSDCARRLLGDWSFAAWDPRRRRLLLARDVLGSGSVYYRSTSGRFWFSSSLKVLLALSPGPSEVDDLAIAKVLVSWAETGAATVYRGVSRLVSGGLVFVEAGAVKCRTYWSAESAPSLRLSSDREYVDAFRAVFTQAVEDRLTARAGATLSGGLDSGAVVAEASALLEPSGRRLPAFCWVPSHDVGAAVGCHRVGDERQLAAETASRLGNVDLRLVESPRSGPLAAIESVLDLHPEPRHAAGNFGMLLSLFHAAGDNGVDTLLVGQGGNATLSWDGGAVLRRLAVQGRWLKLLWELPPAPTVTWRSRLGELRRDLWASPRVRSRDRLSSSEPWSRYSAIAAVFASRLRLLDRMREEGHDPSFSGRIDPFEGRIAWIARMGTSSSLPQTLAGGVGLRVVDPTTDRRLVEFCLGIPLDQFARRGERRLLVRRSMAHRLPESVLNLTRRSLQSGDVAFQVRRTSKEIEAVLSDLDRSERVRESIEIGKMRSILRSVHGCIDPQVTMGCQVILLRGLMVGMFLRRLERGARSPSLRVALANENGRA